TPTETAEPTATPTETAEPTATPTEEPTATPTETAEPTSEPTNEPTTEPTEEPTSEPTEEPTEEPTSEPTTEPTEVPEAEEPESGDQVAPGEEYLAFDKESSSIEDGTYVFTTKAGLENGDVAVTYRTSPGAKPQTIAGTVENGKLTINADEAFAGSITDHNQLLVSVKGSDGRVISALLSGADVLSLQSDIVDSRLGVRLEEAGHKELTFDIPENFPEVTGENFSFDLEYQAADGQ
ncbi:PT domain-containing protein, partial [Glutamicibacter sp.]|uniref:PT domain-containing protein n=1 Tax=Glutamicibacter sp. TaxID=1931995 RepID=UPI002FE16555